MPPTLTPHEFVRKWRGDTRKERSVAQEHFIDLCRLLGHETPGENRDGSLVFEAGVSKTGGGEGWADVWKRGVFGWEYKGPRADLDKAYQQLLKYRESLENPPLLIVCDIQTIVIHTNFTNTIKRTVTLSLDDLLTAGGLETVREAFTNPAYFRAPQTAEHVTQEAAEAFANIAESLRTWGEDPQRAAHFLIRLLFCLFAEDVGLLPNRLFTRLIQSTRTRPLVFAAQLRQLFATMATGGFFGLDEIRHFNGRLFDDDLVLELDSDALNVLSRVASLDWSSIEPAILGTLFERSLDPSKRAQLGAHYTSRSDIMLIVEPVLMAPLYRTWATIQIQARELAARRDAAAGGQRTRLQNELQALLTGFAQEIASVRVLDPACGSGNFLYVALRQLLDLEKAVITLAGDLSVGTFFPAVGPEQLHGIEINEYARELAQATIWIGYIQWLRENGFGAPNDPVLKPLDTILQMDAILAFDAEGKPIEPEWPAADVVIGNPPFLGGSKMRRAMGDEYVEKLWRLYGGRVPAGADLVTYWFERARALIEAGMVRRAGLLATQAIRSNANQRILERIKETGDIFMAWRDRPWVLDGADVRVAMVGFDGGQEAGRSLDGEHVRAIHADLTSAIDLTPARQLRENIGIAFVGSQKIGAFDIPASFAQQMLTLPHNPNGRPNSDVVRPLLNGSDVMGRSRNAWIIDFGIGLTEEQAALYETPFEYVRTHVFPERSQNRRDSYARKWWQHGEARPGMRRAMANVSRFIVTSRVAKHRVFVWVHPPTLPDHKLCVIVREDDYFLGVLQSRLHEVWSLARSGRHGVGDDPAYSASSAFETFPFPWPPGAEPQGDPRVDAIAAAAKRLVELRDAWLNPPGASEAELKKRTLTNLYNERPTWLEMAHRTLDQAVFDAYGWPHDLRDEQILERLLALNLERAAREGGALAAANDEDE